MAGGFDLVPETLAAIKSGDLDYTIDQQPYLQGFLPVLALYLYKLSGGLIFPSETNTGLLFVTKDNVDPYQTTKTRYEGSSTDAEAASSGPGAIAHALGQAALIAREPSQRSRVTVPPRGCAAWRRRPDRPLPRAGLRRGADPATALLRRARGERPDRRDRPWWSTSRSPAVDLPDQRQPAQHRPGHRADRDRRRRHRAAAGQRRDRPVGRHGVRRWRRSSCTT